MTKNLLKNLRGNQTQTELAKKYTVSQQCWQSWETGRTIPPPHIMKQIEIDFNIPMEDIFYDAFHKKC